MYNHIAGSADRHPGVQIENEEYEAFLLIPDHVAVSFLSNPPRPSLHIGRFYFAGIFHAEGGEFTLAVVNLRNGESQDSLLKRFRKKVVKSGVLSTVRRKRWFVSKSEQRRMEKKKAIRRIKRRTFTKDGE
jgi:small subunit ribosomal protein S21